MKTVQYLDATYLERCSSMSADEILQFLDDFQRLHSSIKILDPEKQHKLPKQTVNDRLD